MCERFNGNETWDMFSNCDLAKTKFKSTRAGWIEYFFPTKGKVIAR